MQPNKDIYDPDYYNVKSACEDAGYYGYDDCCNEEPETLPWNEGTAKKNRMIYKPVNFYDFFMTQKKYRVHYLEIKGTDMQNHLEQFLNDLEGEVVSIIPNIKKGSLSQIYGITTRVDILMIVEKIGN